MLELRILTGLHRGAALPVDGDAIRIGSAAGNDLVLLDPGMPAVACTIYRFANSSWRYHTYASTRSSDDAFGEADASGGTPLIAGARWFAGPVLIGCDEEASPWPSGQPQSDTLQPVRRDGRPMSPKAKRCLALAAAIGFAGIVSALTLRSPRVGSAPSHAATSPAQSAPDAARTPVRVVSGAVYPSQAVRRPPFEIRSASTGPYGFIVTRDDQILIPGSRLGAFTLVRIEPGRAVFTGPHAAELTW
ncbi:FHA domain-containing protein [Trinickia sp.]|uniref:FHA domain-containing protein n=1 Tax=Trinickia sp. TaxID=2571163 RepID=UPI003F7FCC39